MASPNPCFGMVPPPRAAPRATANGNMSTGNEYGTMLQIRNVHMLPDGRSFVETWGTWRFRIMDRGMRDGYMVARVERIEDFDEPEEELEASAPPAPLESQHAGSSLSATVPAPSADSVEAAVQAELDEGIDSWADSAASTSAVTSGSAQPIPSTSRCPDVTSDDDVGRPAVRTGEANAPEPQGAGGVTATTPPVGQTQIGAAPRRVPTNAELMATCHRFIEQTRQGTPWVVQHLHNLNYVPMPSDPASFSFWMALVRERCAFWRRAGAD